MTSNIILGADAYKFSQYKQYPSDTTHITSYIEPRSGPTDVVVAGVSSVIEEFFQPRVTERDVSFAANVAAATGIPFNVDAWTDIINTHEGRLPLSIESMDEGLRVPVGTAMVQVLNTDPKHAWLTSYVETVLLRSVWYASTVATNSYNIRVLLKEFMDLSSDAPSEEALAFKLNDFGARGVSSRESAMEGGLAHLYSFMGTDNLEAVVRASEVHGDAISTIGGSIPASEHSTMTCWGGREGEIDAFTNMLDQFPTGLVACVSDSYNIWDAVKYKWGSTLKTRIINRPGTLVVRPDSGDPVETPVRVIEELMGVFGFSINKKGFKVLPEYIRVIQGDGINVDSIQQICELMTYKDLSFDNIAFGMGGALLQGHTRDDYGFAMKASAIKRSGKWSDVFKDPVGGSKTSKPGRLAVGRADGKFFTTRHTNLKEGQSNFLTQRYFNGHLVNKSSLADIRERIRR